MTTLITIIHIIACIFLILVVLLQAGKGGGVGVALGGQTSAQVFGGRGAGTFLEQLTAGTAIVFMLTSMTLAYFASHTDSARLQRESQALAAKKKIDDQKSADEKARKEAEDQAPKPATDEAKPDATKLDVAPEAPKADAPVEEAPKAKPKAKAKSAPEAAPAAEEAPAP